MSNILEVVWKGRALSFMLYYVQTMSRGVNHVFLNRMGERRRKGWLGMATAHPAGMRCSAHTNLHASPDGAWLRGTASGTKKKGRCPRGWNNWSAVKQSLIGSKKLKANHGLICHFPNNILGWTLDVLIPKTNLWVSLWGWLRGRYIFGQRLFWWALRNNSSMLLSFVSSTPCGGRGQANK